MYDLAVKAFKEKLLGNAPVEVFLTDDETNLKSTLKEHFPDIPQLLCLWHVHKNVQTQAQKLWRINTTSEQENEANKEKRKAFMGHFKKTTYAKSEEEFEDLWRALQQEYGDQTKIRLPQIPKEKGVCEGLVFEGQELWP
jgi:hypothetical protein